MGEEYKYRDAQVNVSGGHIYPIYPIGTGTEYHTFGGAQSRLMRKTIYVNPGGRGVYDVRIMRITPDSNDDRLRNASSWTALRSISSDYPVNTPYPVYLLAVRIRATGQLSGSIDTLTVQYRTKILDWDEETKTWIKRYTSNPASIFRNVLQHRYAFAMPQEDNRIDIAGIIEAHNWWREKAWSYNIVMDTAVSVVERLQSICASGLASPTMIDGKWSIIIDRPREQITMAFTSANAWAWEFSKTFVTLPHEIHCNFIDDYTWDKTMRVVATDEPLLDKRIIESQDYEGVTNPAQVYQLARYHYADAKMRRRTISLKCYDSGIIPTRGDLVQCAAPSVSPHGLQVGRVRSVKRDSNDNVLYFTTDQTQTTDLSGRKFGVRVYAKNGSIFHAEVKPEDRTHAKITLLTPQMMDIHVSDKYAFGDYNEEVFDAIVLSLRCNNDLTFDIELQDYTPQIYGDLSNPIPPFSLFTTKELFSKWKLATKPTIINYLSDESVLLKTQSGTIPRIFVTYTHPVNIDERAKYIEIQISGSEDNVYTTYKSFIPLDVTSIYIDGVEDKKTYHIRMRYTGDLTHGDWVYCKNIYCIGRSTPPPPPDRISINGEIITWEMSKQPDDVIGWEVYGGYSENILFSESSLLSDGIIPVKIFDLSKMHGAVKRVFVVTVDEIKLRSEPKSVVVNLGDIKTENVVLTRYEKDSGWDGVLENGAIVNNCIYSTTDKKLWDDTKFWGNTRFWAGEAIQSVYTTYQVVTDVCAGTTLKIKPIVVEGSILKIEYGRGIPTVLWGETRLWGESLFWKLPVQPSQWLSIVGSIPVESGEVIFLKITTANSEFTQICDIEWIFDVPDAIPLEVPDVVIPVNGKIIDVPEGYFRWIETITLGLQYDSEYKTAHSAQWVDKGTAQDGFIAVGPKIIVVDKDGNSVQGVVDVIIAGAKGRA